MLEGKRVILGVTGSIAAYKSAEIVRLLIKAGAEVKVILTEAGSDFVTPVTLSTLSKNPVISGFYTNKDSGEWVNHVELGLWADLMLIAPATANTLSAMAIGRSDNILIATYLSARCPVWVAPAMDLDMFAHPTTFENLKKLQMHGVKIIEPAEGELASGLYGKGRMEEPQHIVDLLQKSLLSHSPLAGKAVLITAGPTYEKIDPVRFIGNHSSGKMGYAIAKDLLDRGAKVFMVSGPTHQVLEHANLRIERVQSAQEMFDVVSDHFGECAVGIFSAAVADYRPQSIADHKIKKEDDSFSIDLVKNPDISMACGRAKRKDQMLVGFALETNNEEENASAKLRKKNLDMIVLNSLQDSGAGFGGDNNKVTILDAHNKKVSFELKSKAEVAKDILDHLEKLMG